MYRNTRVPIAIRDLQKKELDCIEKTPIIANITTPTLWVNSWVAFEKTPGKLRISLDPRDLNNAFCDPIAQCLSCFRQCHSCSVLVVARSFTCDQVTGPLNLRGNLHSSLSLIHRMEGTEIIVDDILIYGRTISEHDEEIRKVLQRFHEKGIKMNSDKFEADLKEVQFCNVMPTGRTEGCSD